MDEQAGSVASAKARVDDELIDGIGHSKFEDDIQLSTADERSGELQEQDGHADDLGGDGGGGEEDKTVAQAKDDTEGVGTFDAKKDGREGHPDNDEVDAGEEERHVPNNGEEDESSLPHNDSGKEHEQPMPREQAGAGGDEGGVITGRIPQAQNREAQRSGRGGSNGGEKGTETALQSSSVPAAPEWPPYCDPDYRMPDEINVSATLDSGEVRNMSIQIERFTEQKPFHGGYRHKGTAKVYHHASTQFGQREPTMKNTAHLRTRDTQTYRIKSTRMQTTNECGTQMARKGLHFDNSRDVVKSAGKYQTTEEFWRVRALKTVVIQRFWRGFAARSRVWARREEKWTRQAVVEEAAQEEEEKKDRQRQREMHRRMNPRTVQDFEVLYNELDQWRNAETKRIKDAECGERRKLALRELLHKETRLLQTIDRLKITAAQEGKQRRTKRMLELMSAPKKWEMGDGEIAEIKTPWTNRAQELQELFEALEAPLLSVEERLDVLLHLKWTVSEFDCRLTRDIAELVDREADLLSRGRGEASLRPLRQRIRNLFLRFTETPDFNPEATRFLRVPPKYSKLTEQGVAELTTISA